MPTAHDVTEWMKQKLEQDEMLYQDEAATEIEQRFGAKFVYTNDNGNTAISRLVLNEFRRLTEHDVVWERSDKMWRKREDLTSLGRGPSNSAFCRLPSLGLSCYHPHMKQNPANQDIADPAMFPVGSVQSRAAARALLASRIDYLTLEQDCRR